MFFLLETSTEENKVEEDVEMSEENKCEDTNQDKTTGMCKLYSDILSIVHFQNKLYTYPQPNLHPEK